MRTIIDEPEEEKPHPLLGWCYAMQVVGLLMQIAGLILKYIFKYD